MRVVEYGCVGHIHDRIGHVNFMLFVHFFHVRELYETRTQFLVEYGLMGLTSSHAAAI